MLMRIIKKDLIKKQTQFEVKILSKMNELLENQKQNLNKPGKIEKSFDSQLRKIKKDLQ
jgi:hypothetical protein